MPSRCSAAGIGVRSDFPFQGSGPRFCPSPQDVDADTDRKIDDNEEKARVPVARPIECLSSRGVSAFARHRSIFLKNPASPARARGVAGDSPKPPVNFPSDIAADDWLC